MAIKLSGPRAFRPVVMVVAVGIAPFFVAIIIATWSGGRGGWSSAEPLETWSTWSVVDVVGARRSRSRRGRRGPWSEGMYVVPSHGEAKALRHVQPRSGAVEDLPCLREGYGVA